MSEKQAVGREKESREDMDLSDIIDPRALQSIFDDFYRIAPIPMAILDMQGEAFVGIGWHDICTCFHRVNP